MSEDAVRAEVAALRAVAPRFDELARRIREAASVLTDRCAAEGECWGSDAPGSALASGYAPGREAALQRIAASARALSAVGAGLRLAADSYERTDLASAAALARN